jgi:hypothetical protein
MLIKKLVGIAAHWSSILASTVTLTLKYGIGTRDVNPPLKAPGMSQSCGKIA